VNAAAGSVRVTLRRARGAQAQQRALDSWLAAAPAPRAVVAEAAFSALAAPPEVPIERLAAGCLCCVGLTPLRVTIARTLRAVRPRALLLLVASDEHLPRLRALLASGELGATSLDPSD